VSTITVSFSAFVLLVWIQVKALDL